MQLEEIALADDYFVSRKLYPNVDFYTGLIYKAMGFPTQMFTVLFALGRLPGWIAQWREMIDDPATKIGRPRQVYTGATERDYVPVGATLTQPAAGVRRQPAVAGMIGDDVARPCCGSAATCGWPTTPRCWPQRPTTPTCWAFSSPTTPCCRPSGAPRRAFLAGCLARLSESMGGRLLIVHGRPDAVIPRVAAAVGAAAVHVSADYGPVRPARDERVEKACAQGHRAGRDRLAVRGGARSGAQAGRHPVRGVHPVLPRLDRRTAGARPAKPAGSRLDRPRRSRSRRRLTPADSVRRFLDDLTCPSPARPRRSGPGGTSWTTPSDGYDDERDRPDHPAPAGCRRT